MDKKEALDSLDLECAECKADLTGEGCAYCEKPLKRKQKIYCSEIYGEEEVASMNHYCSEKCIANDLGQQTVVL